MKKGQRKTIDGKYPTEKNLYVWHHAYGRMKVDLGVDSGAWAYGRDRAGNQQVPVSSCYSSRKAMGASK